MSGKATGNHPREQFTQDIIMERTLHSTLGMSMAQQGEIKFVLYRI